jgi:ELWxxDGT repeat protein
MTPARCRALSLALAALSMTNGALQAEGPAHLVKDINVTAYPYTVGPDRAVVAGRNLFLGGFVTDGTSTGTRTVPGIAGLGMTLFQPPVVLGDSFYFVGNDGFHGAELWRTDGTAAGTGLVRDIAPGPRSSSVQTPAVFRRAVYFGANDGTHGYQLWKTDANSGAVALLDAPTSDGFLGLTAAADRLYFVAQVNRGPGTPYDLYVTDGTTTGTVFLHTFVGEAPGGCYTEGCPGWGPGSFTALGGRAYFIASEGTSGLELWRSDGTASGTTRVKDICPGTCSGFLYSDGISFGDSPALQIVGGRLFFFANDGVHGMEPWTSDGTETGTRMVKDLAAGAASSSYGIEMVSDGSVAFFGATPQGWQLWRSDGSDQGTFSVWTAGPNVRGPIRILTSGRNVFFATADQGRNASLWKTDDAGSAPVLLATNLSQPVAIADLSGTLFFVAAESDGVSLWRSNGTRDGTLRVTLLVPAENAPSLPFILGPLGDTLVFGATDGSSFRLWETDGTEASTRSFSAVSPSGDLFASGAFAASFLGSLFFSGNDGSGRELWRTDGTPESTRIVRKVGHSGTRFGFLTESLPSGLQVVDGLLYFDAYDGDRGRSIFRSDGTEEGTIFLAAASRGERSGMVSFGGRVYFGAFDQDSHLGLWRTDGTPEETVRVRGIPTFLLTAFRNRLYFVGEEGGTSGAWTSDGTSEGTVLFLPGIGDIAATSASLFLVDRGTGGTPPRLWRSDGTLPATLLAEFPQQSWPGSLTLAGDRLFFVAGEADHGFELWTSDGTPAGTRVVRDIWPGPGDSWPQGLTAINGLLLFSARDPIHGDELWRSDGTEEGTWLVQDIFPGSGSSSPDSFTLAGPTLYFTADDGRTGRELWAVPWAAIDPPPGRRPRVPPIVPWRH